MTVVHVSACARTYMHAQGHSSDGNRQQRDTGLCCYAICIYSGKYDGVARGVEEVDGLPGRTLFLPYSCNPNTSELPRLKRLKSVCMKCFYVLLAFRQKAQNCTLKDISCRTC